MSRNNYGLLEAGWIPGHLDAFRPNATGKIRLYDSGGGGGAPAPSSVSQTTIPEYAQPYAERLLGQAEAKIFTKDAGTGEITGFQPYQTYGGERLAPSTQEQQAVRQRVAGMQGPQQFGTGTELATQAGLASLGAGQYQPGVFAAPLTQAQQLRQFQMRAPADVTAGQFTAPQMGTAQTGFAPALERFQMTEPERFGTQAAQEYMSPYMQEAVDVQKREAIRDAQKAQLAQNLAAARQGTYGGARQTLAATERERNLQEQLSRIQGMGTQAAFEQAASQFERDRAARMGAQQQNLQAALGVQQLGTQTGLQAALANLSSAQQANVQNLAAQLQTQGLSADQALRAALANQQAGLTTAQQNLAARLGVQQLGAQTGLESQRLNQAALMQAQELAERSRQFGAGLGLQGAQAATQAAATLGQLGIGQQQQALDLAKAQEAFGGLGRAEQQAKMDLAYQDFLQQQRYPFSQLGFMSDILRGSGNLAATGGRAIYEQPPSTTQQLMQLGLGGLGLYRAMGAGA